MDCPRTYSFGGTQGPPFIHSGMASGLCSSRLTQRKVHFSLAVGSEDNIRNPLTGQLMQEGRPPEECAKWVRERPQLRLIEDPQFFMAQAILDDNDARC